MRFLPEQVSVRRASRVAIALLVLSSSTAVLSLVWSSNLLQQTGGALARAAGGLALANEIEQRLLTHQRLAILTDGASEEAADVEQGIFEALALSRRDSAGGAEGELLDRLTEQVAAYLERLEQLQRAGAGPVETLQEVRPALDDAIETVSSLMRIREQALENGNVRAQRLGRFFKATALVAAVLALVLVVAIAYAVRAVILRPILEIRDAITQFRGGDFEARAEERMPRELSEIAAAFNHMAAELARQREQQLAFIGGVAHDLRNPLSALKAGVSALEIDAVEAGARRHTLHILSRQLDHLERMVGDLLEVSRIEAGKLELNVAPLDLRDAATAVADLYAPVTDRREIRLELDEEAVTVAGDRMRIEQMIGNLVKNAIKYSPDRAPVTIAVSLDGDEAEVAVSDRGAGIAEDEIDIIFRPFRHGSSARSSGAGLGLSIVRRIAVAHGGRVAVESALGSGSTFRVRLPLAPRGAAGSRG